MSSSLVDRFRDALTRRTGLTFDDSRHGVLGDLLRSRSRERGQDAATYLRAFEQGWADDEIEALAPELTVGETYFFRNSDQFRALASLPAPGGALRVLSAGCATGEEPYSIAMTLAGANVSIRAVDINAVSLQRARQARYSSWSLRETPAEARQLWFCQDGRDVVLDDRIKAAVTFERRNLAVADDELWRQASYDVVFCRNVIMYLTPEHAAAVIERISRALAPSGHLFLGHAETLHGLSTSFHLVHTHDTFYYQRKTPSVDSTWMETIRASTDKVAALIEPLPKRGWDLNAAYELLRDSRFSDALALIQGWPRDASLDPNVLLLEAVLLTHTGALAGAREVCERLLLLDELNADAHYLLALCREAEGDHQRAADHDHTALHLAPTFAMARLHLGQLARRSGDLAAARRELHQALDLLQREDASRLLLFGGGFGREALLAMCRAELQRVVTDDEGER